MKRSFFVVLLSLCALPFACAEKGAPATPGSTTTSAGGTGGSGGAPVCVADEETLFVPHQPQSTCCPSPEDPSQPLVTCRGICSLDIVGYVEDNTEIREAQCHCGFVSFDGTKHTGPGPCAEEHECCREIGAWGSYAQGQGREDLCVPKGNCVDCRPERSEAPNVMTGCCFDPSALGAPPLSCRGGCDEQGNCRCGATEGGCGEGLECCHNPFRDAECVAWGTCPLGEPTGGQDCDSVEAAAHTWLSCCNGETCRGVCLDAPGEGQGQACYCQGEGSCPEGQECCDQGICGVACVPTGTCAACII